MAKILMINGSLRQGSFNQATIDYVMELLERKGYEARQLDYSTLPFFNEDVEFPTPKIVEGVRMEVEWADAVWIVTPKYNGAIPGHLKVLLDWLSRPVNKGDQGAPSIIQNKPVAISSTAGPHGAQEVLDSLTALLKRMKMTVLETPQLGLIIPKEAWETGVMILDEDQKTGLAEEVTVFLETIDQIGKDKK